jgi:WD40 repeat protein
MVAFMRGGSLILFDLTASRVVQRLNGDPVANAIAFSPDGSLVVAYGPGMKIWDVRSGQIVLNQSADAPIQQVLFGANALSHFFAVVASGNGSGGVALWKLPDAHASTVEYQYPHREPSQLAINGLGTMLAVGSKDGSIDLWKIPAALTEPDSFAGAPDAWHLLADLHASTAPIEALGFSPDSKYLATSSWKEDAEGRTVDSNVRVWGLDLAPQKAAAARSNVKQLFQMGCQRLQVYLDATAGSSAAPVKDVDLKSLQTACKAALAGGTKSGR